MIQHVGAIQRWNGNQVEVCEQKVEPDAHEHHALCGRQQASSRSSSLTHDSNPHGQDDEHDHQDQIGSYPRQRDDDVAAAVITIVPGIDWYGFRTAEQESPPPIQTTTSPGGAGSSTGRCV